MQTLNELGSSRYANKVNHVFMWQAALPGNSFSTTQPAHDEGSAQPYYFPSAYQGAKTFSVLYSEHDNVLGAAPTRETLNQLSYEKFIDPAVDMPTAILELLINEITRYVPRLPLQSVYHFANLMGKPLTYFYEDAPLRLNHSVPDIAHPSKTAHIKRDEFYATWCTTFNPPDAAKTLLEQHALLIQKGYQRELAILGRFLQVLAEGKIQNQPGRAIVDYVLLKIDLAQMAQPALPEQLAPYPAPRFDNPWATHPSLAGITPANLQMAVIALTCLQTPNAQVRPAMGYSGPDPTDPKTKDLLGKNKILPINQYDWLTSHSAMKIPSKELMEEIYYKKIFKAVGYKLGRYT